MKRILGAALLAVAVLAGQAEAQDMPGLSLGGFYETRIDNEVAGEGFSFDYYGARLQVRDGRWYEVFVDLGAQSAEWDEVEADPSAFLGLGGTLWLVRAEDLMIPLDLGLFASFHQGDLELEAGSASEDATYNKIVAQGVIRAAGYGLVQPFLRVGMMWSELDVDGTDADDWDESNIAINVGVELDVTDNLTVTLEGNHSEGAGLGVHADFWF
ncbi:MAG: hypothetical protein R6X19_11795 [Kiritimatiellia bacterium]